MFFYKCAIDQTKVSSELKLVEKTSIFAYAYLLQVFLKKLKIALPVNR